ncbi:MAG: GTP-binding protein, partial [Candidatus Competibacter denitrificans]
KSAIGLIILVDNSRPDPLADLVVYLDGFAEDLSVLPCAIGIGRLDTHPVPTLEDYIDILANRNQLVPIMSVDVRRREDVVLLIDTLLAQLEANTFGA